MTKPNRIYLMMIILLGFRSPSVIKGQDQFQDFPIACNRYSFSSD